MAKLVLPGYEIIGKIASGGMGAIWSAYSPTRELRAVKVLHPGLAEDPAFHSMLLREAMVVAHLEHDNICRFYTFGKTALGELYLEMEFVDGMTLSALQHKSKQQGIRLPLEVCCQIVHEICVGLGYAHQQVAGLIHRDISPQNVMLSREGTIKILDFGVAKLTQQLDNTQPGTIKGKTSYMSPEQLCGEPLDHRSDIFSLGIVLWELLTGKRLFKADNAGGPAASMFLVLEGEHKPYPSPSSLRPDIPASLDQIAMKALAYTPQERYQNCKELQDALAEWLAQRPPSSIAAFLEECIYGQEQTDTTMNAFPHPPASSLASPSHHYGETIVSLVEHDEVTSSLSNYQFQDVTTPLPSAAMNMLPTRPSYEETVSYAHLSGTHDAEEREFAHADPSQDTNPSIPLPQQTPAALAAIEPVLLLTSPTSYKRSTPHNAPPVAEYHTEEYRGAATDSNGRWLWGFVLVCAVLGGGMYWLLVQRARPAMIAHIPSLSPLHHSRQGDPPKPQGLHSIKPPIGLHIERPVLRLPVPRTIDRIPPTRRHRSIGRRRNKRRKRRKRRTYNKSKHSTKQTQKVSPTIENTPSLPTPTVVSPGQHRCSKDSKWLRISPKTGSPSFLGLRITLNHRTFQFRGSSPAFCILKHIQRITIAPANPTQRKQYWPCSAPIRGKHVVHFSLSDIRGMPTKKCYSVR